MYTQRYLVMCFYTQRHHMKPLYTNIMTRYYNLRDSNNGTELHLKKIKNIWSYYSSKCGYSDMAVPSVMPLNQERVKARIWRMRGGLQGHRHRCHANRWKTRAQSKMQLSFLRACAILKTWHRHPSYGCQLCTLTRKQQNHGHEILPGTTSAQT